MFSYQQPTKVSRPYGGLRAGSTRWFRARLRAGGQHVGADDGGGLARDCVGELGAGTVGKALTASVRRGALDSARYADLRYCLSY